jgi:hypothetical protein
MGCQLGQVARLAPAFGQRLAPEPDNHPDDIRGGRREELLEVRATHLDPAPRFAGSQGGLEEPSAGLMGQHATAKIG